MVKVLFLHPDLGIGGAERLVIDAALALKAKGHDVSFVTTHHDTSHCFKETKDGTLPVKVVGDWIPRNICGRFYALFAYMRMIYAAFYVAFFTDQRPDVVFCDIVSACIPILRLNRSLRVLFYCHFPDQLLSKPEGLLKRLYRIPIDWLEEISTGCAHKVLVNSNFTAGVFASTFKRLSGKVTPSVLYPCVDFSKFETVSLDSKNDALKEIGVSTDAVVLLSINRYERKKNLFLAIDTLKYLKDAIPGNVWETVYLVMAGGYDLRVTENIDHLDELIAHSKKLGVADKVIFLKSPSDHLKVGLLHTACCLLYTPSGEHFGIVPIEAMSAGCPVVAVNVGGPTETVVDGVTGFLCDSSADSFGDALVKCILNPSLRKKMGEEGKRHVKSSFSSETFADSLNAEVESLLSGIKSIAKEN
ncbi:alpha-1,3/1,6-mannosyltransferase ALG2 [Ischnura elegans]|uniref:alpha-1,3/1,6-mannosyltransferase ALG2 n=1 Tax=Ischnura elegans TaxID=197161 RepID=UPI001ED88CC4|nr:alpha-1,3/1,6-mannosyltransferase ALG2 [Ischnura elegans]